MNYSVISIIIGCLISMVIMNKLGAEDAPSISLRIVIAVPVGDYPKFPEAVFLVKNIGSKAREIPRVSTTGSVLSWSGPRGIKWVNGGNAVTQTVPILVPANTEVEIDRIPLREIDQMIPNGVEGSKLVEGDIFNAHWEVDGVKSNEISFQYSEIIRTAPK